MFGKLDKYEKWGHKVFLDANGKIPKLWEHNSVLRSSQ